MRPDDFDAASFFDSYYRATSSNAPSDAETIGTVTEPEARFHYNAIENSIIRALVRRQPFDRAAPAVWRFAQRRRRWSVLDVGSGAGHWIEFYRSTYHASRVLGIELVPRLVEHLPSSRPLRFGPGGERQSSRHRGIAAGFGTI